MQRMANDPRCIVLPIKDTVEEDVSTKEARDLARDDNLIALLKLAEQQDWRVTPTNSGKLMWYPPDRSKQPVTSPLALQGRSYRNVMTALQRSGLDVSTLKTDKPKERPASRAVMAVEDPKHIDEPLTPEEQVHVEFQNVLAETLSGLVLEMDGVKQSRANLINTGIDVFLVQTGKALMEFMADTAPAFDCSHTVDEQTKKKLEEAETLYLETCTALEQSQKREEKLKSDLSRVGSELQAALSEKNEALERALKAENKLRAFRAALQED